MPISPPPPISLRASLTPFFPCPVGRGGHHFPGVACAQPYQYPQVVGDGLEKGTCLHMEVHAKCQEQERIRLLWELEQATREQRPGNSCGVTLWAALKQWPLWATAAVLLLLLVWCFLLFGPVSSGQEKYSSSNMDETANDKGNNAVAKEVLETSPDTQS